MSVLKVGRCHACKSEQPLRSETWIPVGRRIGVRLYYCATCGARAKVGRAKAPRKRLKATRAKDARKMAMERCDALARRICKLRDDWTCQVCGARIVSDWLMQWAHGISRGRWAVRHNEDNYWSLCQPHHAYYTHRQAEWKDWRLAQLGTQRFAEIEKLSEIPNKAVNFAAIEPMLQMRLQQLEARQ